jgi:osmoprotectant transport system permease protein
MRALAVVLAVLLLSACTSQPRGPSPLRVGSKRFTESYILAEIAAQVSRATGEAEVELSTGLGGTAIVFRALEEGSIDVYPEYTGTLAEAILHVAPRTELPELARLLAERGLGVTAPLGFSNSYALAVAGTSPKMRDVRRISDLAHRSNVVLGLSPEFLGRGDGWPGVASTYGLTALSPRAVDHGLAYDAVASGELDITDVYSTDAKITRFGLRVLDDDRHSFPPYDAVFVYRLAVRDRLPKTFADLTRLAGAIEAEKMTALNARVEIEGLSFAEAAQSFVESLGMASAAHPPRGAAPWWIQELLVIRSEGPRHLFLVFVSVLFATLIGVPLGIVAYRSPRVGSVIVGVTGILQTIPSLALLCFMIPLFGIGTLPALVALFFYALLPIVRNTAVGLGDIPGAVREVAAAIGLPANARLVRVELPLASRAIFSGIKTSAVINVGTATLAAFIGAGGFGAPISTGLNLNDNGMILLGAVPSALLAIVLQGSFGVVERFVVPLGLRLEAIRGRS